MNEKKFIKKTLIFEAKVITPIHIGNGETLENNFDFIYNNKDKTYFILDQKSIKDNLSIEFLKQLDSIDKYSSEIKQLFKSRKLKIKNRFSYREEYSNLWLFVRENNIPIIPGSSIKGAIRTAILSNILKNRLQNKTKIPYKFEKLLEYNFNNNQRQNSNSLKFMQAIRVEDIYLEEKMLQFLPYKTLSLKRGNIFVEKIDKTRIAESLKIGTNFNIKIQLVYNPKIYYKFIDYLDNFLEKLKNYSKDFSKSEKNFIEKNDFPKNRRFNNVYEDIIKSEKIFINIGFGTGWKCKTGGELIDNKEFWGNSILYYKDRKDKYDFFKIINNFRYLKCPRGHTGLKPSKKNSGKVFCNKCNKEYSLNDLEIIFPFPKSKKVVENYNNIYYFPGWLELNLLDIKE